MEGGKGSETETLFFEQVAEDLAKGRITSQDRYNPYLHLPAYSSFHSLAVHLELIFGVDNPGEIMDKYDIYDIYSAMDQAAHAWRSHPIAGASGLLLYHLREGTKGY